MRLAKSATFLGNHDGRWLRLEPRGVQMLLDVLGPLLLWPEVFRAEVTELGLGHLEDGCGGGDITGWYVYRW